MFSGLVPVLAMLVVSGGIASAQTSDTVIKDVSPTTETFPAEVGHSPSGRVLSLAVSRDGTRLYAGTLSGVMALG
jgi:hypothetical protein